MSRGESRHRGSLAFIPTGPSSLKRRLTCLYVVAINGCRRMAIGAISYHEKGATTCQWLMRPCSQQACDTLCVRRTCRSTSGCRGAADTEIDATGCTLVTRGCPSPRSFVYALRYCNTTAGDCAEVPLVSLVAVSGRARMMSLALSCRNR
ncbi:hypothetical protein FA95DRAFT_1096594 [Auriscalpium vulgare]|uniref:Uncharacterized protein n=1 Tax=Auriscalpium vulgare TaxID=40419 RepID=A0ACB8RXL3_9AGAM|nr:hypothetical protein FA95DRAFT_1096594 [Auriscalpium vulgare]